MVRIECKSFGLDCPYFADVFVGGEAAQRFEPATVIAGIDDVVEMGSQLGMAAVVIALDGCLLDCAVHAFDLAVGPRVPGLGEPVFDSVAPAGAIEGMAPPASGRTLCHYRSTPYG